MTAPPATRPFTLAVTLGDPQGIGPEIALEAALDLAGERLRLVLVGERKVLARAARCRHRRFTGRVLDSPGPLARRAGRLFLQALPDQRHRPPYWGRVTPAGGRAARLAVERAVDLWRAGLADAICTAPLSKEALALAGGKWPGHTELLAELTGAGTPVMLLVGGRLRVALATIHLPLKQVPGRLSRRGLARTMIVVDRDLRARFGLARPRLAVCGLNPHAGEAGAFGREEERLIGPAIRDAIAAGVEAVGPLPADTVFHRAAAGEFPAVLAMYHDQGLIPVKLAAFRRGVNVTLGLPLVRTSPDHGTAFDQAGRGTAWADSMRSAIKLARRLARNEKRCRR